MATRRLRLPKGSRAAVRIAKLLGLSGTGTLLAALAVLSVCMIGAKEVSMAAGQSTCTVPDTTGGPGVEVFGDSTLTGVARVLPTRLAGGRVTDDVQTGRTAQQAENLLNAIPDTAPTVFVMSLAEDDVSSSRAYMARVDELMLLMSGRTVYWVTAPGKASYTAIVTKESATDPTDPEHASGWHIVDFAAGVTQHPGWWNGHQPSSVGAKNLAQVLTTQIVGGAGATTTTSPSPSPTSSPTSTATRTSANSPSLSASAASLVSTANGITVTSSTSSDSFRLVGERLTNARTIVVTGVSMGVPQRGIVIAVATAMQESKLVNLSHGPAGAYGLFQQTPPSWGTITQVETPAYAATSFYTRLLKVPGWQDMALTDAAQAVEVSGYPDAYAQWEQSATVVVAALLGTHATGCGPQVNVPGDPNAQIAVNAALAQLGVPYSFAGGDLQGPTLGRCVRGTSAWNACQIVGFDCSGLMLYAWGKAGVTVPHYTVAMWDDPDFTDIANKADLAPGDMMMFDGPPPGHTAMYIGGGKLIEAPHSGGHVQITSIDDAWHSEHYIGALRPKA